VSGDEDEGGNVERARVVGHDARGVGVRAGPRGGPAPWAPQTDPACVQATCAQCVGEHAAGQRTH
jgi:hypothetical protein